MKNRFVPSDFARRNYLNLHGLEQDGKTVHEYVNEFDRLNILCDQQDSDEQKLTRFVAELNDYIKDQLDLIWMKVG